MLNKEEIEKRVTYAKSKFWEIKHREPTEGIEILLEIIEQLEQKANKYDSLVEKIENKIENLGISDVDIYLQCELQELLKEAEDE